ncbi:hypothetical protein V502_04354 [Pseudogymnoascus sp. VKM F-4520 (FW-2644)]|nr:hypothetical protein V502_04354 [Pseudogymnoascus sp. VKM F-4520 (FW-2644)]
MHLPTKRQAERAIRHPGAGPIGKPLAEPDVLGPALVAAHLVLQDLDDGRDAAEGEAAVAAPFAVGVPGRADPVEVQPFVDGLARVGAEHAVCLEDEEVFGGAEELFVDPEGGEEDGDLFLGGRRHVGRDQREIELPDPHLLADGVGLVYRLHGLWGAHEAESPFGGHDGHEVQHERGEDGVGSVLDQEGDARGVEGGVPGGGGGEGGVVGVGEADFWDLGGGGAPEGEGYEAGEAALAMSLIFNFFFLQDLSWDLGPGGVVMARDGETHTKTAMAASARMRRDVCPQSSMGSRLKASNRSASPERVAPAAEESDHRGPAGEGEESIAGCGIVGGD